MERGLETTPLRDTTASFGGRRNGKLREVVPVNYIDLYNIATSGLNSGGAHGMLVEKFIGGDPFA